jgi:hypothetical protein
MTSTLHSPTLAIPAGSHGIVEPRRRTLAVTAFATLVALAAFTTSPATMSQTVASLGGGTAGLTWGLSAMASAWPRRCCRSARSPTTSGGDGSWSGAPRCWPQRARSLRWRPRSASLSVHGSFRESPAAE